MRLDLATDDFIGARSQQQDAAAARSIGTNGGAILVLADGLGGHTGGAEASRIVVETFSAAADTGIFDSEAGRRPALRDTLEKANERIADGVEPAHGHRGMASTAVAVVVADGMVNWISVGDSHLYVWRRGRLAKLNEDHSQAGLMVRSGQYKADDPEVAAAKSVLVSALTGRKLEIVDHPVQAFAVQKGDVVLLASDGLNTLSETEIEAAVTAVQEHGASRISTALLDHIRERRADRQDNTAVVVARIVDLPARTHDVPTQLAEDTQRVTAPTALASATAHLEETGAHTPADAGRTPADAAGSAGHHAGHVQAVRQVEPATSSLSPAPSLAPASAPASASASASPATGAPAAKSSVAPGDISGAAAKTEAVAVPRRKEQPPTLPVRQSRLPPGLIGNMIVALAIAAIAAGTYLFWKPSQDARDKRPASTKQTPAVTGTPAAAQPPAETAPKSQAAPPVLQPLTEQPKQPVTAPATPIPAPAPPSAPALQAAPAPQATPGIEPVRPLQLIQPAPSEATRTPGASGAPVPLPQSPPLLEQPSPAVPRGSQLNLNPAAPPAVRSLLPSQR